jgi:CRISPR-associated endoribonuclease Cas6
MRIRFEFDIPTETSLPYHYTYALMSYFYHVIRLTDPSLADWLHQEGIAFEGRKYKPFVFSPLLFSQCKKAPDKMTVQGKMTWKVDSIHPPIMQALYHGMNTLSHLKLFKHSFPLKSIQIEERPTFQQTMNYRCLGPVVIPISKNGKLLLCHPLESDFYDQIRSSLQRWAKLKWGTDYSDPSPIRIRLLDPDRFRLEQAAQLTEIKGKKIKGYKMPLQIEASVRIQEVAIEAGIGSYTNQGFGMLEPI